MHDSSELHCIKYKVLLEHLKFQIIMFDQTRHVNSFTFLYVGVSMLFM